MFLQVEAVSTHISFLKRNVDSKRNDKIEIVPVEVPKQMEYHQLELAQDPKLNHDFQAWVLRWQ